jgi:hypothetical protein
MKIILDWIRRLELQKAMKALAFGIILTMAVTGSAHAADRHVTGRSAAGARDWRGHENRNQRDWHGSGGYVPAGVIYAPPVVYAPPQYEEPGLNLVIPINIR